VPRAVRGRSRRAGLRWEAAAPVLASVVVAGLLLNIPSAPAVAAAPAPPGQAPTEPGPDRAYQCRFDVQTDAFTGANGTASAIGWLGDHDSVVTCLGGSFLIQDGPDGYFRSYGFGLYHGQRTTWADAGGYLPAQVTSFADRGAHVAITEFADEETFGGQNYVAVYCRVRIANETGHPVTVDPAPSPSLVPLTHPSDTVPSHGVAQHDYVVAADRFGSAAPWPSAAELAGAGGLDQHFVHMRGFWDEQLAGIAQVHVPAPALVDAYKSGFVTTELTRRGDALDTGVNGYEGEFSHDVVGILTNLFTQGAFADAHALLTEMRNVVGAQGQYVDGLWTSTVPWAVYLMKTGDAAFVASNFATEGAGGTAQPSIEDAAHAIAADRTGPMGTMEATDDIDTQGYWTVDDYEALLGLAAYRYIAAALGQTSEATWASVQYAGLLGATNAVLGQTIARHQLTYLPCSLLQPNTANRCANPRDANWTSPFGFGSWAWEGSLLGATVEGPGLTLIDATYTYGFGRLRGLLPAGTTGGFPGDEYASAYDAAQGASGLAGTTHRDQGIVDYEFMIADDQSGPFSWWESSSAPAATPWVGRHPATGQGSAPHAWGMAGANKVLLDSLVAQRSDGALVVGRGVPSTWLGRGPIAVANFPTTAGRRVAVKITASQTSVTLAVRGSLAGPVLFELPAFRGNLASASAGSIEESAGIVRVPAAVRRVTVTLKSAP